MSYIYETHLHTIDSSACGKSKGEDYLKAYQDMGYAGIIVTDHFFNGNCAVPATLPWAERVEQFCRGYELTKEAGDKISFPVFFGWEDCYDRDEYLIYGLDKQWLLAHPDILSWDHIEHYERIHADGGLVVQAHPFRERDYIERINLHPFQCDAWEVENACNPVLQDICAYNYAKDHQIRMTAGSDIHDVGQALEGNCFGVAFEEPIHSIQDYVDRILSGQYTLHTPEGRLNTVSHPESTSTPIYLFDKQNKQTPVTLQQLTKANAL